MIFTRNISEPMSVRMSLNLKRTVIEDLSKFRSKLSHPGITTPIGDSEKDQLERILKILDNAVQEIGNVS